MAKAPVRGERGTPAPKRPKKNNAPAGRGAGGGTVKKKKNPTKAKSPRPKRPKAASVLNPPFDPRMRSIGSPLNRGKDLKRGWIQDAAGEIGRVDFLFNPQELSVNAEQDPNAATAVDKPSLDTGDPLYVTGVNLGFKLLYDRTYDLFSSPGTGAGRTAASKFGVFADVAAWYILLSMMEDLPDSWDDTMIVSPLVRTECFLFIGPRQFYYGVVTSLNVMYSHWSQDMVPQRCSVDVGFMILPFEDNLEKNGVETPPLDPSFIDPSIGWRTGRDVG